MKPYQAKIHYNRVQSAILDVTAGPFELTIDPSYVHNFVGVVFYSDADGETVVQPTAGTVNFKVKLVVQPHLWQDLPDNAIDASIADQTDWSGNTEVVQWSIAGLAGAATHCRLIVAGNSS